jgi:hypothetical protein
MGQNPLSYYNTLYWIKTQYPCLGRQGQQNPTKSVIHINEFMGLSHISFYFILFGEGATLIGPWSNFLEHLGTSQ